MRLEWTFCYDLNFFFYFLTYQTRALAWRSLNLFGNILVCEILKPRPLCCLPLIVFMNRFPRKTLTQTARSAVSHARNFLGICMKERSTPNVTALFPSETRQLRVFLMKGQACYLEVPRGELWRVEIASEFLTHLGRGAGPMPLAIFPGEWVPTAINQAVKSFQTL